LKKNKFDISKEDLSRYFEWDIFNWSRVLSLWEPKILELKKNSRQLKGLEIGGRQGGLSLMMANEYKINTVLTDVQFTSKQIKYIEEYDIYGLISTENQNVMNLTYESNQFDLIIFKSVLGALGSIQNQELALKEIYRCLKPGGVMLFAENLRCTWVHSLLRNIFNPWSRSHWYYPSYNELGASLNLIFSESRLEYFGFLGLFSRGKSINYVLSKIDVIIAPVIPNSWRYIAFGWCSK
jgi:ubiquinone/menaquinone biosynthesis C-methylase UbiE